MTFSKDVQPAVRGRGGALDVNGFTAKQAQYIEEIQIDWNGTQAAIRAGYSVKSAGDMAYELNHNPKIVDAIMAAMSKRAEKAKIDANWVLVRLVATERQIAARGKKMNPLHRLRALESIGRHVDVNAFRTQFGVGNPDGTPLDSRWDFSRLSDEEFDQLGRLLRKCAAGGPGNGDDDARSAALVALGAGEGPATEGPRPEGG